VTIRRGHPKRSSGGSDRRHLGVEFRRVLLDLAEEFIIILGAEMDVLVRSRVAAVHCSHRLIPSFFQLP